VRERTSTGIGSTQARTPRPPQDNVPRTMAERVRLRSLVRRYVDEERLVPPLSLIDLQAHAKRVVELAEVPGKYQSWLTVLVNNATWSETVARTPFHRRLLLLPQCLRDGDHCPGDIDEFGLVCHHCGRCAIHTLSEEAERLGYVVLIAEGTTVVTSLIQTGKIDALVGVSCLDSLERVFPYMEAAAIPGVAIPLLRDGCVNTTTDLDWVLDAIQLTSADRTRRLDLDALRSLVESWFTPEALEETMGPARTRTEQIARGWLAKSGKRWRPFLTVCAFQALQDDPSAAPPDAVRAAAVAIECFHKASLVHDDIEDDDDWRYGEQTLHMAHGVPVALNAGDLLLGEGYRLLAEADVPAACQAEMVRAATQGHRDLCVGQGEELSWMRRPEPLTPEQVLDIFRLKTAPAFEVALRLGIVQAEAPADVRDALRAYSEALGIAYQIRDDLEDFYAEASQAPPHLGGPSILLAIAWERADEQARPLLERVWHDPTSRAASNGDLKALLGRLGAHTVATEMLAEYKAQAIAALRPLQSASLKGLLRRVICKIFSELEPSG